MVESKTLVTLLAAVLIYSASYILKTIIHTRRLRAIPTVGSIFPYIGALQFLLNGRGMLQKGYGQYRKSTYKIPMMSQWLVIAPGFDKVEEIRRAPDDVLSAQDAVADTLHTDITLGPEIHANPFHVDIIKTTLTRNIGAAFPDIYDEIITAFAEYIPTKEHEWTKVVLYSTVMNVVCRSSNRIFVGLPLCRNIDYMSLTKNFTIDLAFHSLHAHRPTYSFLRTVAYLFTNIYSDVKRGKRHLEPLIKERLEYEAQYGKNWPGKPNDLISWLLDVAERDQRSVSNITKRVLFTNFTAIHTSTIAAVQILYDLANHSEYMQPLREEIEAVVQEDGWTKAAMGKLRKLDSFMKESMRFSFLSSLGLKRKVMKDFTFSDGTTIPAGCIAAVPLNCIHADSIPSTAFGSSRCVNKMEKAVKHQFVTLDSTYLLFGHGRHACPGRFFAESEVKAILAHILMAYDIEMPNGRPSNVYFGEAVLCDTNAEMLFRKRTGTDVSKM
ncbi:cytochrome P450 [Amanita rubescens]|nr:cytochrome P450 [Amanita rubescens]